MEESKVFFRKGVNIDFIARVVYWPSPGGKVKNEGVTLDDINSATC